jgi:TIR domain
LSGRVFISYSHKDAALRDRLETHLAMLKRQGAIEAWNDRRLIAGDEFNGRISEELERADVILLLVSPDFLASDYCYDVEMARAMERHEARKARVIPIVLRPCDWHSAPFGKLVAAPTDGKPIVSWPDLNAAFLDVVQKIRAALPRGTVQPTRATGTPRPAEPRAAERPRSSNLRLKKTFTEADREHFLDEAFTFMAQFFEASLDELRKRHDGIETKFRRVDANRFTSVIYRNGKAISRCKIVLGGMFGTGISYSHTDSIDDGSYSDSLSVESDDQGLYLKALGMAHLGQNREPHLTFEGAAEYYWSLLIERLQ